MTESKRYTIPVCKGCGLPVTAVVRKEFSCMCQHNHGEEWVEVEPVSKREGKQEGLKSHAQIEYEYRKWGCDDR